MSRGGSSAGGRASRRDPDLIPIFLDDPHKASAYAKPFLWPIDGNAKKTAENLCRPHPGTRESNALSYQTTSHTLASYSDTFRDTYLRAPNSRLISLQYVVQVQDEPPIIFADIIKWDTNTPDVLIGSYAARAAKDVGLGHRAAILIEEEVKKQVYRARSGIKAGTEQLIERPEDGSTIISKPSKFPKLIRGDQARQLLERHAAKKRAALETGGGTPAGTSPSPLEIPKS